MPQTTHVQIGTNCDFLVHYIKSASYNFKIFLFNSWILSVDSNWNFLNCIFDLPLWCFDVEVVIIYPKTSSIWFFVHTGMIRIFCTPISTPLFQFWKLIPNCNQPPKKKEQLLYVIIQTDWSKLVSVGGGEYISF